MPKAKLAAKIELCHVGLDAARELGVQPGMAPRHASTAVDYFREWGRTEPWCAPLNIAGTSEVFDFTRGYDPDRKLSATFGIGRYGEDRVGMYETALFKSQSDPRTIHMGLDIGAAEGTPVFAPLAAEIWGRQILPSAGDYGGTIVLKTGGPVSLYILFGHLSHASVDRWRVGTRVQGGELLGWLGGKVENGGWNPHLHWQVSWLEPLRVDLPGAVTKKHEPLARLVFSDPTEILKDSVGGWGAG